MSEEIMRNEQSYDLVITPKAGDIVSNIDGLGPFLKQITEPYIGQVVTEDQVSFAKKDLALLRKLNTQLEDERKRAKAVINKPYAEFEIKYKAAKASLDEAIAGIDRQVKEIEAAAKAKRQEELVDFTLKEAKAIGGESLLIRMEKAEVQAWFFDPKWVNASASDTAVQLAIREKLNQFDRDYDCILKTAPDPVAIDTLLKTGSLSAAFEKKREIDEIKRQQEVDAAARRAAEESAKAAEAEGQPDLLQPQITPPAANIDENKASEIAIDNHDNVITMQVPEVPDDDSLLQDMKLPVVLVFPKYKKAMVREIMTKAGIRMLKPPKEA